MRLHWESLLPSNLTDWVVIICPCAPASADAPIYSENGLGVPCSTLGVPFPQDHHAFWLVPVCTTYWVVKSTSLEAHYQRARPSASWCGTHHIYTPNGDSPEFFAQLIENIEALQSLFTILGGNFNLVMNTEIDRKGSNINNCKALEILRFYMEEKELCDIWQTRNPELFQFTLYRLKPVPVFSQLDMFLASMGFTHCVETIEIKPGYKLDHSMVVMKWCFSENKRGMGVWKLITNHLQDKEFIEKINDIMSICMPSVTHLIDGRPLNKMWQFIARIFLLKRPWKQTKVWYSGTPVAHSLT